MHTIGDSICRDVHDAQQARNSDEELEQFEENGSSDSFLGRWEVFEKSQLCKRIANNRLQFQAHSTSRGKGDACLAWKHHGRPRVVHIIEEARKLTTSILEHYMEPFDAMCEAEGLDEYHLPGPDDPEYCKKLIDFLREHHTAHPEDRAGLSEEEANMLTTHEVVISDALEKEMEDITNMAFHLSLKRTLDQLWQQSWTAPEPRTVYILWDHMVPRKTHI